MAEDKQVNPEERYRYIGFEVFGDKPQKFWKDDEEKKSHIQRVKAAVGSLYRNSVVYASVLSKTDRLFIIFASALMILAPFLPWFSVKSLCGSQSFLGVTGLFGMGSFWFYVSKMGGMVVPLSIYLLALLSYISLAIGVWTLLTVYGKAPSEEAYLAKLKKVLRFNAIPLGVFLLIIVLSLIGQRIPFGPYLGIENLSGHYSIVTLIQFSSIGLWMSFFGFMLNFNKSKEF
jgi:hypothetical protein